MSTYDLAAAEAIIDRAREELAALMGYDHERFVPSLTALMKQVTNDVRTESLGPCRGLVDVERLREDGVCPRCGRRFDYTGAATSIAEVVRLHEAIDCPNSPPTPRQIPVRVPVDPDCEHCGGEGWVSKSQVLTRRAGKEPWRDPAGGLTPLIRPRGEPMHEANHWRDAMAYELVREQRDAWEELAMGLDHLLACYRSGRTPTAGYRTGRTPSDALLARVQEARERVAALAKESRDA